MASSTGNSFRSQRNIAVMLEEPWIQLFHMSTISHIGISLLLLLKVSRVPAQVSSFPVSVVLRLSHATLRQLRSKDRSLSCSALTAHNSVVQGIEVRDVLFATKSSHVDYASFSLELNFNY